MASREIRSIGDGYWSSCCEIDCGIILSWPQTNASYAFSSNSRRTMNLAHDGRLSAPIEPHPLLETIVYTMPERLEVFHNPTITLLLHVNILTTATATAFLPLLLFYPLFELLHAVGDPPVKLGVTALH